MSHKPPKKKHAASPQGEKQGSQLEQLLKWIQETFLYKLRYLLLPLHHGTARHRKEPVNLYTLRRNTHRLEKGLIHKKKKPVFAQDYVLETLFAYHYCKSRGLMDPAMSAWVEAVLDAYFQAVQKTAPMVMEAWTYYQGLSPNNTVPDSKPYAITRRPPLTVSFEEFNALSHRRRSVRHFVDRTVEPAVVANAMEAAAQAPSACNRQAFRFLFYNDPAIVNQLAGITGGVANYTLPSLIVIVADYLGYADERDIKSPIIDASLAAMSLCYALETLGLSSVCINWPCVVPFDEKLRSIISLEPQEAVIMLMGVGYPADDALIPFSPKKPVNMLLEVNQRIKA